MYEVQDEKNEIEILRFAQNGNEMENVFFFGWNLISSNYECTNRYDLLIVIDNQMAFRVNSNRKIEIHVILRLRRTWVCVHKFKFYVSVDTTYDVSAVRHSDRT